jgi:hypothetical protein
VVLCIQPMVVTKLVLFRPRFPGRLLATGVVTPERSAVVAVHLSRGFSVKESLTHTYCRVFAPSPSTARVRSLVTLRSFHGGGFRRDFAVMIFRFCFFFSSTLIVRLRFLFGCARTTYCMLWTTDLSRHDRRWLQYTNARDTRVEIFVKNTLVDCTSVSYMGFTAQLQLPIRFRVHTTTFWEGEGEGMCSWIRYSRVNW